MYNLQFRDELPEPIAREFDLFLSRLRGFMDVSFNEDGTLRAGPENLAAQIPVGVMQSYGGTSAPRGWLLCDGSPVSRITYAALFTMIGTAFGAGDGVTTFNVPDARGRFLIGAGGLISLGGTGGSLDHTHEIATDGSHDHGGATSEDGEHEHLIDTVESATGGNDSDTEVQGGTGASAAAPGHVHGVFGDVFPEGDHTHTITSGGSHAHGGATGEANPPYLGANYIIFAGV